MFEEKNNNQIEENKSQNAELDVTNSNTTNEVETNSNDVTSSNTTNEVETNSNEETNSNTTNEVETNNSTTSEEVVTPMDPIVEVNTTYDYKTLKYCNMYLIRVKRHSRITYIIMMISSLAIALLTLFLMEGTNKYLSIVLFALTLWTLYSMLTEESKINKSLASFFKTHPRFYQNVKIDDEKVRVTAIVDGEERSGDYPWAYIREINVIPDYVLFFLGGGSPIIVARTPEAFIKGNIDDLSKIISDKAVLKPYKEYKGPLGSKMIDVQYYETKDTSETDSSDENDTSDK